MSQSRPKQLQLIQALRGLAAIAVVLFHVDQLSNERLATHFLGGIFQFGWIGVDFFFVLSGFIILYTQLPKPTKRGWQSWWRFIVRRAVRIYPAYWVVMGGVLTLLLVVPALKNNSAITPGYIVQSVLLLPQSEAPILSVAWTLTLIMFFYGVASLAFVLPRRVYAALVVVILVGSLSQFLSVFTIPRSKPLLWMAFNAFHWEFAGGALIGYYLLRYGPLKPSLFWLTLGTVGVLGFSFAQTYGIIQEVNAIAIGNTELLITRVIFTGLPCLAVVLGAASLDYQGRIQIPAVLALLGNASYSIYLVHSPVISACTQILAKLNLEAGPGVITLANCAIAILSTGLGVGFYYVLERPLVNWLKPHLP